MEAKLISIGEVALGAALEIIETSDGDPAALLMFAANGIGQALEEIGCAAYDKTDSGKSYHDLATLTLVACAAYHEMKREH